MNRKNQNLSATITKISNLRSTAPWFKTWFDSTYYHKLYQNRNDEEAKEFIDALLTELSPEPGSIMIDLGCGAGRHSKYLASKGYGVLGMDLSLSSIRQAKKFQVPGLRFVQADMRQPFGKACFDYVFNFFTSFGYCKKRSENENVVENIMASLKPGGTVVFDYLNVAYAEANLVPVEEKEIDDLHYHINRWADNNFIYKRIAIQQGQGASPQVHVEQVAKFGLADFKQMLSLHGGDVTTVFGNYNLDTYDAATSKRLVVIAKKLPVN